MLAHKEVDSTYIKLIEGHTGAMSLTEQVYTYIDIYKLLKVINKI